MNIKIKISFIFFLFLNLFAESLHSQHFIRNFGIKSELSFLNYTYDFNSLPSIPRPDISLTIFDNKPVLSYGATASFNIFKDVFLSSSLLYSKSELDFQDLENVVVIIQGEPIEAIIRHNLETEITNLSVALGTGYQLFETLNLSFGVGFYYPLTSNFNQEQKIVSPEGLDFIYPVGNHKGKIPDLSTLIYVPEVKLSLDENIISFGKIGLSPAISFIFGTNSLLKTSDWRFSAISGGISLVYINKTEKTFRFDSTITRDTLSTFSSEISNERLQLIETRSIYDTLLADNSTIYLINTKETYERVIPKPKPLLNGELKTVFVSDDGSESVSKEIEYIKNIYLINYYEKKGRKEKLTSKIDTVSSLKTPFIRFYPSAFSEAGLKEWQINISRSNEVVKTYLGYEIVSDVLDWYPFENKDFKDNQEIMFKYEFIIEDFEGQKIAASIGEISFKQSTKEEKINKINLLVIEPEKISESSFRKLFSNLKKNKKVILYYPFLSGMEEIIKPDFIIEPNAEILEVTSSINKDKTMIIIGFN